jgi:uncharacterized membrane protein YkgB
MRAFKCPKPAANSAFLLKDLVLLAVSFYLLKQDLVRVIESRHNGPADS